MSGGFETWQTWYLDGTQATHLVVSGYDLTICGHDIAGDDTIHRKEPQSITNKTRVTCVYCQKIIRTVKEYKKL